MSWDIITVTALLARVEDRLEPGADAWPIILEEAANMEEENEND